MREAEAGDADVRVGGPEEEGEGEEGEGGEEGREAAAAAAGAAQAAADGDEEDVGVRVGRRVVAEVEVPGAGEDATATGFALTRAAVM